MAGERRFLAVQEVRPCIAAGQKALFHMWVNESRVVPPSPLVGGHSGGQVSTIRALVEDERGNMKMVQPKDIRFLDHPFQDYHWGEEQ